MDGFTFVQQVRKLLNFDIVVADDLVIKVAIVRDKNFVKLYPNFE